jgi:hypothetical protein
MSLESKIDELIAALAANTAALAGGKPSPVSAQADAAPPAKRPPGRPPKKTEDQLIAEAKARVAAVEKTVEDEPENGEDDAGPTVTKEAAAKVLQQLITASRDEAVKLLKKYGASSLGSLPEAKYGEFVAEGEEVLLSL